jgi:hypothetical protein
VKISLEINRKMQKVLPRKNPASTQNRPGTEAKMIPVPVSDYPDKPGSEKLKIK